MTGKPSSMTLYSDDRDHLSHRVRIVLAEKDVAVDLQSVSAATLSPAVRELSPYGSLPVLQDRDGLALFESRVMMEYLDERFPHPPLLPVYPVTRAQCRQWIDRLDREWSPLVATLTHSESDPEKAAARQQLQESLSAVAPAFAGTSFFLSEQFSLMDCCLAAMLWRLEVMGIVLAPTAQHRPLLDYMQRVFSREAFRSSLSESERLMCKTALFG